MIELEKHKHGTIISVRAQPGARRNELRGVQNRQLKVYVTAVPEKGRANKAIIRALAEGLSLRKSQIELVAGEISKQKKFLIRGVEPDELLPLIERSTSK